MIRRYVLIPLMLALALTAIAPVATAQEGDSAPSELWDEFPLEPTATPEGAAATATPTPEVVRVRPDGGISTPALIALLLGAGALGGIAARFAVRRIPGRTPTLESNMSEVPAVAASEATAPRRTRAMPEDAGAERSRPRGVRRAKPAETGDATPAAAQAGPARDAERAARSLRRRAKLIVTGDAVPAAKPVEPADTAKATRSPEPAGTAAPSAEPADTAEAEPAKPRRTRRAKPPATEEPAPAAAPAKPRRTRRAKPPATEDAAPAAAPAKPRRTRRAKPPATEDAAPAAEPQIHAPEPDLDARPRQRRFEPSGTFGETAWETCAIKLQTREARGRFHAIATSDGQVLARSPVFPLKHSKRSGATTAPEALHALVDQLGAAGWRQTSVGEKPWDLSFRRRSAAPQPSPAERRP